MNRMDMLGQTFDLSEQFIENAVNRIRREARDFGESDNLQVLDIIIELLRIQRFLLRVRHDMDRLHVRIRSLRNHGTFSRSTRCLSFLVQPQAERNPSDRDDDAANRANGLNRRVDLDSSGNSNPSTSSSEE